MSAEQCWIPARAVVRSGSAPTTGTAGIQQGSRERVGEGQAYLAGGSLAGYVVAVSRVYLSHSAPAFLVLMYSIMYSWPTSTG